MSEERAPATRREAAAALIESIDAADNPERELLKHIIDRTAHKDPALAEAIGYCAIPRSFNVEIIGALRQAPDDRVTNDRLLGGLVRFSFVHRQSGGGYTYDDGTRDLLLEEWRADERRAEFDELNRRLVRFHQDQHEQARRIEKDMERVAGVMRRANLERYVHLASIVETRVVAPLLDALYHETLQAAEAGYDLFVSYFEEYEAHGRLTVCESLVNATRDYLERLPRDDGQEGWRHWMRYWHARLQRRQGKHEDAERLLVKLLPRTGADNKLRLWVLGDLAEALHQQFRLREARETYTQLLALGEEPRADPYNLPTWQSALAGLHWTLDELDGAADKYREAVQSAWEQTNPRMRGFALLNLSGVLHARGEWEGALHAALEALDLVHGEFPRDRDLRHALAVRFMHLFARRDQRLLDTTFREARGLVTDLGERLWGLDLRSQYVGALQQGGQLGRAGTALAELKTDATDFDQASFGMELLLRESLLHEERGRLAEAVALYTQMLERSAHSRRGLETNWYRAVALSNRGMAHETLARWPEARADLQAALAAWERIGHDKLAALTRVCLATAARRQGRLAEAQLLLDQAEGPLLDTGSGYLADYHQARGDVQRDQARWSEARQHYQQAYAINCALDQSKQAAQNLRELVSVAAAQGQWEEAGRHAAEAADRWRQLAAMDRHQPRAAELQADDENARGLRRLCTPGGDQREQAIRARELFRAASERVPDNVWYRLNLSSACAMLATWDAWQEAAEALETAIEHGPTWLRAPLLYERLADYRLKQSKAQFDAGLYEAAARSCATCLARLADRVPLARLLPFWLWLGDSLLKLGRFADARAAYQDGLARAMASEDVMRQAGFRLRLAFLAASQVHLSGAVEHLRAGLERWTEAGRPDTIWESLRDSFELIDSLQQYHALSGALRIMTDNPTLDAAQRRDVVTIRLELSRSKYRRLLRPSGEAVPAEVAGTPDARPLLEADARLFPQGGNTPQVIRLIETDIPAMRGRIRERTGVTVPGVLIRASESLSAGGYTLLLDEIPLARGTVRAGARYCLDAAACRALGLDGPLAANPGGTRGGQGVREGMWLPEAAQATAAAAGLPLWDPYDYMLAHLEALIHRHLGRFLGLQEVQTMLDRWAGEQEDRRVLLAAAAPDDAALVRLTGVLRGLLAEGVPIRDLNTILTDFAGANARSPEVWEVIESIRLAVRAELPGNAGASQLLELPPEFERELARWVGTRDGKRFLAIPPEEAWRLLGVVREHLPALAAPDTVAVVREPGLRPFARRFLERAFPALPVLAARELIAGSPLAAEREGTLHRLPVADG